MEELDDILAHYGVMGMKWGVRKDRSSPSKVKVVGSSNRRIKTTGGTGYKPSSEALKTASLQRKGTASGSQSLTNEELKESIKRMQMEQQYNQLSSGHNPNLRKRGANFVKTLLGVGKTVNEAAAFAASPAGKSIASELKKVRK